MYSKNPGPFSSLVVTGTAMSFHLIDAVVSVEETRKLRFVAQTLLERTGLERMPFELLGAPYLLSHVANEGIRCKVMTSCPRERKSTPVVCTFLRKSGYSGQVATCP